MATVFDVAKYILSKMQPLSAMKLQKLVYYSQAWSVVWDDAPLFTEKIEAWANGPVTRSLYEAHRGQYLIDMSFFDTANLNALTQTNKETIDAVLEAYGNKSAQWLSDQTHSESPWIHARTGLAENERGDKEIPLDSLSEYYGSLS